MCYLELINDSLYRYFKIINYNILQLNVIKFIYHLFIFLCNLKIIYNNI